MILRLIAAEACTVLLQLLLFIKDLMRIVQIIFTVVNSVGHVYLVFSDKTLHACILPSLH